MQTLYAIETMQEAPKPGEAVKILQKHFDQSRQLFVYLVYFLTELARYAETDSRLLPAVRRDTPYSMKLVPISS